MHSYRVQQQLRELEAQAKDSGKLQDPVTSHLPKADAPNLEGVEEEVELGEEGLQRLQDEVDELQDLFDKAVMDKHSLAQTCQELAEKLKSANHLLERYNVGGEAEGGRGRKGGRGGRRD